MACNLLTEKEVANAKPGKSERLLADGDRLFLRVHPEGSGRSKEWMFVYTFNGKRRKMGLGSFPTVSLKMARDLASKYRKQLASNIDPQVARDAEIQAQEAKRKEQEAAAARLTVKGLFDLWLKGEASGRADGGKEIQRSFGKDVLPFIGSKYADQVTRGDIADLLAAVKERGAPVKARQLLGDIRQMYGYGIENGKLTIDPTAHMKKNKVGQVQERDRTLSEAEIRELAMALPESGMPIQNQLALWVQLATACRIGEIIQAKWADVDLDAGEWVIPAENSKNGRAHTIYLSAFALDKFKALKELANGSVWVLPASQKENEHIDLKAITKQVGDRQRGDKEAMNGRSRKTNALTLSGGKWTPHDLRRTAATIMGDVLKVRPDVIEKCLNHTDGNRIKRTYQRQELKPEQQEAWRLLGERLEFLTRK